MNRPVRLLRVQLEWHGRKQPDGWLKEDAKDAVLPSEGTADAKQSTLTGTISDIKDFMFTITADGTDYEFSFEQDQKPDGLSDVKDGDKVTVTYTGTVSEVDAFSGTVLSVKKAE
mgnify:CR=1 FL=1